MIKIEINPINVSTNTCLQNSLTRNKKTILNHLIKTIVHVVGECVITKHFMCLRENRERQAFLPILDKNIPHYSLDKEFTNELVDRANLKSKVPQMFGTNF